jgi:hypothetical protein
MTATCRAGVPSDGLDSGSGRSDGSACLIPIFVPAGVVVTKVEALDHPSVCRQADYLAEARITRHELDAKTQAVHDVSVARCYVHRGSVLPDQQDSLYGWVATNDDTARSVPRIPTCVDVQTSATPQLGAAHASTIDHPVIVFDVEQRTIPVVAAPRRQRPPCPVLDRSVVDYSLGHDADPRCRTPHLRLGAARQSVQALAP